jgi:hypothetical protein
MKLHIRREARNGGEISPASATTRQPSPSKGRLLFVQDVREELLNRRRSASWIRHHFAPQHKHKLGRDCFWHEEEARSWLDSLKEGV